MRRRSGVALPLFSIYSKRSTGIGEISDLRQIIDWCALTGNTILQLLPLNELGYDFSPYNSISTFAIEPMYLCIDKLRKSDLTPFKKEIRELKKKYSISADRVDYSIKKAKLDLLRKIFETADYSSADNFNLFVKDNFHWLKYFALYKVLRKLNNDRNWEQWELNYKYISSLNAERILSEQKNEIFFQYWLQWQLFEQLKTVKRYAKQKNILLMGDIPFLVSRESADVWAYKNYFKLNLSSGAPPDMYLSEGQRWGMPPYNWANIEADNFGYVKHRLKYAENFYDMFRIDHFVGLFRVWTIDVKLPKGYGGQHGKFDPEEEYLWEPHGRRILRVVCDATSMLPCAEDLGTVPDCSDKVLREFGIPGINVMRWTKKENNNFEFLPAEDYRLNSVAVLSTHDSSTFPDWWNNEAGTLDEFSFRKACERIDITGNHYADVVRILFNEKSGSVKKLLWNDSISNVYILLKILNKDFSAAHEIVSMYLSSYSEKKRFAEYIGMKGDLKPASTGFVQKGLNKISSSSSIFSIQLITEYLFLDNKILKTIPACNYRINTPGTIGENNWTIRLPVSIEELMEMKINSLIKKINLKNDRG